MSFEYWVALRNTIPIKPHPDAKPLAKPTDEMIAAFEQESRLKLPLGYKEYIKVFGAGELAWKYIIKAPGYPKRGYYVDLWTFNGVIHAGFSDDFLARQADPDQVTRMLFFCDTGGAGIIGWDPLDVQNAENHEYGIYKLFDETSVVKIADSFQDFIEDVCLGEENLNIPGWNLEELGPRRFFDPACDLSDESS